MAYSLSAGNAGTSFRYRTHLVTLAFAMMVVLRTRAAAAVAPAFATPARLAPAPARSGRSRGETEWSNRVPGGV
jgi:hypothetical protein